MTLLKNYLRTAYRSLFRHRFFSAINILGLSVAMSICLGIIMLVADQLTYDRHNPLRHRIYRITTHDVDGNGQMTNGQTSATSPLTLRQELLEAYTGQQRVVRLMRGFGNGWLEFENQNVNIPLAGFFADPEVLEVFDYELEAGDAATALIQPFTVVLTRQAAHKLFANENALGQTIKVGDLGTYTVTGILKETDHKSHLVFEALASMTTVNSLPNKDVLSQWTNYWNGWTYVLTQPEQTRDQLQRHLDQIFERHIGSIDNPGVHKMTFGLQPLMEITPGPLTNNPIGPVLPWFFVYFLGGLALVILLTSCFNFTNLSIARSLTRAREIGIRKVTGAARWQLVSQFLSESVLLAFVALLFAMVLLLLVKPMILQLNFARIFRWDLAMNTTVLGAFVAFAALVGLLAGLFPAAVLSGFQPINVLKNLNNVKLFSRMGLRKALLVSQFTLSLFFILSVLVLHRQVNIFLRQDHGFNMTHNVAIRLNDTPADLLKTELLKHANVLHVAAASHLPASGTSYGEGYKRALDDPEWSNVGYFLVDEDYLTNMGVSLVAGRFFSDRATAATQNYIVINQTAVTHFRFASAQEAVGQALLIERDSSERTILGVVADYNHRDLTQPISPMALVYDSAQFNLLQVSYTGTYAEVARVIEGAWAAVNPGLKADVEPVDSEVKQFYEIIFGDIARVLAVISFLAIVISCLGLLGMATYTTETRIKEISIRKVLGSSNGSLVVLLSKGFVGLLAMSVALGVPLAYFVNNLWLQLIAYRASFSVSIVLTGMTVLLAFGGVTIASQTLRAMFVNPVQHLKNE
ncbi:MAG: ABC transporter permease [Cyclobacteriaceae bacterium]|nr:ABC transporter permease [Cyclobacteriaceae bacterium]